MSETRVVDIENIAEKLLTAQDILNGFFKEREEVIHTSLLSFVGAGHHLQLGPPGTAKTMIAEVIAEGVKHARLFSALMSKALPPDEILGPPSLKGFDEDDYRRAIDGFIQTADIIILDEVYKAGDANCNPLLRIMNEGTYRNGREVVVCPRIMISGCSNEMHDGPALAAFHDRWTFKHDVKDLSTKENFKAMLSGSLKKSRPDITPAGLELADAHALRSILPSVVVPEACMDVLYDIRTALLEEHQIRFSPRKGVWALCHVLRAEALFHGRFEAEVEDMAVLSHVLWDDPKEAEHVFDIVYRLVQPAKQEAEAMVRKARTFFEGAVRTLEQAGGDEVVKKNVAADAHSDIGDLYRKLEAKKKQASAKNAEIYDKAMERVERYNSRVDSEILGLKEEAHAG